MNDPSLTDPELRTLAARLAAIAPLVPVAEQQRLLYASAFSAGQKSTLRTVRHWQSVAAGLVILLVGLTISRGSQHVMLAEHSNERTASPQQVARDRAVERTEGISAMRQVTLADLDAWQLRPRENYLSPESLLQRKPIDPRLQPFTVSALTRAYLRP